MKKIVIERVLHNNESRVTLKFPYDPELIGLTKSLTDARWSQQMYCWHVPDNSNVISVLYKIFTGKAFLDYSALKPVNIAEKILKKREEKQRTKGFISKNIKYSDFPSLSEKGNEDIEAYRTWMETCRYPESTVKTYVSMMEKFLSFVFPKEASDCVPDDLIRIVDEYILPAGLSYSFQNQMISSVKKFYSHFYNSYFDIGKITRPRAQHRIPNVLSKAEVKKILDALRNEKHRVMLCLIYACGLRRSELLRMKPGDIERERNLVRIRQSKGYKDRVVPISDRTIEMIDLYLKHYTPVRYLFEGIVPGEPYSATSLEKVVKNACDKAFIQKDVTLHWLRHSYATHLLESGTDLRYIQELLGHKSSKTTEIYTHVTTKSIQKIRSPFDDL